MPDLGAFTDANLDKQGFSGLDKQAKARYQSALRFTPGVGTSLIVAGLVLQSPRWLAAMALVALSGALLPGAMIIDVVYNLAVRHLFGAPALPTTPKPRQFSYLFSTLLLAVSAVSFAGGLPALGFVTGGVVVLGGTMLTATLWCLGSWFYRLILGR